MADSRTERVESLLEQAGAAHHSFEQEELDGERDEDWPQWYAAYLLENGLATLMTPPPNQADLAQRLADSTSAHEESDDDQSWAAFTAPRLLAPDA